MTSEAAPNIGDARDILEVDYWLLLHGCPQCGERSIGTPRYLEEYDSEMNTASLDVTCPRCGHQRTVQFGKLPGYDRPLGVRLGHFQLGGAEPSRIISPHLFAKELARCMAEMGPGTPANVESLKALRAYTYEWAPFHNGATSSLELAKFLPDGADSIPDKFFVTEEARAYRAAHPDQFTRGYIEMCVRHFAELGPALMAIADAFDAQESSTTTDSRPLPLPPFSQAALAFHERWVEHGDGEKRQRMVAVGADARERNLSGRNLSKVSLENVTLDRANLSHAQFQLAELIKISARDAQWSHAGLVETTLRGCNFTGSDLTSALLHHSTIEGCNFSGARLAYASLRDATITRTAFVSADLTDARLHDAVFTDCDLHGAKLGVTPGSEPRLTDVTFIRCDLRDTDWRGRKLVRIKLIDCKLAGAHGAPVFEEASILRPDLSPSGDGTVIGDEHDVTRSIAR